MSKELEKIEDTEVVVSQESAETSESVVVIPQNQPVTPDSMLMAMAQSGATPADISAMMALKREWDADEAKKAYVVAMAQFKADAPLLVKDNEVRYKNKDGSWTVYSHAKLGSMATSISERMGRFGLCFRWDTEQLDGGMVKVTCVIPHALGHSENTALQSGSDQSGGKNNIQAIGSTVSYLQRYTLLAATGLATNDTDDDGQSAEEIDAEYITDEQIADIRALLTEIGKDEKKYLAYQDIGDLCEILAKQYDGVIKQLERSRK